MHNTLTKKKATPEVALPAPTLFPVQDISAKPFKLSSFTSRSTRKRKKIDPRQMLLWEKED